MPAKLSRQSRATFFFALAHPRRLRIIELLQSCPEGLSFDALSTRTGMGDGSLTHHLGKISAAGLIARRIKGPRTIYSLNSERLAEIPLPAPALLRDAA